MPRGKKSEASTTSMTASSSEEEPGSVIREGVTTGATGPRAARSKAKRAAADVAGTDVGTGAAKSAKSAANKRAGGRKASDESSSADGRRSESDASEHEEDGEGEGDVDLADEAEELEGVDEADGEVEVEGELDDGDGDGAVKSKAKRLSGAKRQTSASGERGEARGGAITGFDPMAAYLREVQRHRLLTPEETHDIAVQFVEGQSPALAAKLVTSNLRLVVKIAYEYRRAYKNIMDLVQEGNIGLMQAVKRYDPYRNVKLSSYAAWWIRAYILRFILNNWRLVKLGTTQAQRKLFFNLRKKRAELQALGIDPTHEEIAKQLNVPESDVAEMDVRLSSNERSLDAPVGDAEGRSIARVDMMPSLAQGPETLVAGEELQSLLKDKLADFRHTLAGKEKDLAIFDERLVADEPLTLQELGDRFGISRERVRQLEQRLTGKLREFLEDAMGDAAHVQ